MTNEFFTNEYTSVLQKLVREVQSDPAMFLGRKYLPAVAVPTDKIRVEVLEASGGLTNEHAIGTDPKYVKQAGSRVQEFSGGAYKEAIHWNEKDILHLRALGQNDPEKRGVRQYIDRAIDRLNRRVESRIEKLRWDCLINGTYTYFNRVFSFGVPAANRAVPLSAVWSSDGISPNNSSNPIADLRYWTQGGYAPYRKYKFKEAVMNPNTLRWVMENSNTKSYITNFGGNANITEWDINKLLRFAIPASSMTVTCYDGWYQTESEDANGRILVSDATYMLPDGYILFVPDLPDGDVYGEFVEGIHLASGTVDAPGFGKFLVVEECILPGTKGGPKNPFIDLVAGVYGGPKLDRAMDLLTAKVIA